MAESLTPAPQGDRPNLERRPSKNPLRNMMQHLTVEPPEDDDGSPSRGSLIRRLSWRKSRSPSAHSDASAHSSASVRNRDPALCISCSSLAADVEHTFEEIDQTFLKKLHPAAEDAFDEREYLVSPLPGLAEAELAVPCPLCSLLRAVRVSSQSRGDYSLSAFSSRDTNYLIDSNRMFDMDHPARGQARGLAPGFLAVVPQRKGDGAQPWNVKSDWFRDNGMLFRVPPQASLEPHVMRGRSRSGDRLTPEPSAVHSDSSWTQKGIWGREIAQSADLRVVRDWLQFCDRHHPGRCGRRQVTNNIPGFKLIDCTHSPPQVVRGQLSESYAALSYVYGNTASEPWPQAIRDAVTVARQLGLRYLWVDRLCIDGADPQQRMGHIERMDEIFEGAVITIIAVHGQDAAQGLPGIGTTRRPEQPKYRFADGNVTLVSSLRDPRLDIQDSVWYTRGWTYQEGLLARRRLIFTGQQMYWECEGMSCPETLVLPLATYYDREQEKMGDFVRPGLFNGVSFMDGSWEVWKKMPQTTEEPSTLSIFRQSDQHIVQYTRRRLTDDRDSLNAFLGITRRLERTIGHGKLGSIVGIPLWCPATPSTGRGDPARTKLVFALTTCFWHHVQCNDHHPQRRRHLPSWTWAGWRGAVELHSSIAVVEQDGTSRERKVFNHHYVSATQLTRNDSSSLKWSYCPDFVLLAADGRAVYDFQPSREPPSFAPSRYLLRVTNPLVLDKVKAQVHSGGWMFNNVCVDVRMSSGRGTETSASAEAGKPSAIREYLEAHARGERMTILWFIEEATVMLLVVQRTQSKTWERIGRARMGFRQDARDVLRRFGHLDAMIESLPLRRLGQDIVIE